MFRRISLMAFMALLIVPAASAQDTYTPQQLAALSVEERLHLLEENDAELYETLAGKKVAGLASRIAERLTLSGLLEVEAFVSVVDYDAADSDAASDLSLATAWAALGVQVNEFVTADLSLLYEEGDTPLEVDEAAINFEHGPWFGRVGQQYLPFGVFYSHFISDPLTLELGETRETAALGGYDTPLFSLCAFVFNGRGEEAGGEEHLSDWGASLTLSPLEGVSLGGSYLSDLSDTDAELLADADNLWNRRVAGWSAYAIYEGFVKLSGEVLGATRSFEDGRQPLTWNLEAAYALQENLEAALRLAGSDKLVGAPELQYGADVSWSPLEGVVLSLEYLRGEFDAELVEADDDGRVTDTVDMITAQLGLEF